MSNIKSIKKKILKFQIKKLLKNLKLKKKISNKKKIFYKIKNFEEIKKKKN